MAEFLCRKKSPYLIKHTQRTMSCFSLISRPSFYSIQGNALFIVSFFYKKKVLQFASLIDLLLFPHTWYLSVCSFAYLFENNYFQSISHSFVVSKLHIDSSMLQKKTVHPRFISFPSFKKKRISFRHQTMCNRDSSMPPPWRMTVGPITYAKPLLRNARLNRSSSLIWLS